ncbi:MAG: hypothetical protein JRI77_14110, partial [Deltaproteobacteria bacterium]|nr:hypothetical protein [Deltaproteobacteria bacterium]
MISSINGSISALKALGKKVAVAADNVANLQSKGFKKKRAVLQEGQQKQVTVQIEKIDTPGPIVTEIEGEKIVEKELSNVDLVEEIPQTIVTQRHYEANLKAVQTQDEVLKT